MSERKMREDGLGRDPDGSGCHPSDETPTGSHASGASIPRARASVNALLDKFWLASAVLESARVEHDAKLEEQRRYGMRKPKSDETLDRVAAARVCFEHAVKALREAYPAPGCEARSAETQGGSVYEHPIGKAEAPINSIMLSALKAMDEALTSLWGGPTGSGSDAEHFVDPDLLKAWIQIRSAISQADKAGEARSLLSQPTEGE